MEGGVIRSTSCAWPWRRKGRTGTFNVPANICQKYARNNGLSPWPAMLAGGLNPPVIPVGKVGGRHQIVQNSAKTASFIPCATNGNLLNIWANSCSVNP